MLLAADRQHKLFVLNMLYKMLFDFSNTGSIQKVYIDNIHMHCMRIMKSKDRLYHDIKEILCIKDTEFDIIYQLKFLITGDNFLKRLKRELFNAQSDLYDNTHIVNSISLFIEGINDKTLERSRVQTYFDRHPVLIHHSKVTYRIRNIKSEVYKIKDVNISYNHRLHPLADIHKTVKNIESNMVYKVSMTDLTYYIPYYRSYYDSIYELKLPKVSQ